MAVRNHRRERELAITELRRQEGLEEVELEKIEIQRKNSELVREHRVMTPMETARLFRVSEKLTEIMHGPPRINDNLPPANEVDFSRALGDSLPTIDDISAKEG